MLVPKKSLDFIEEGYSYHFRNSLYNDYYYTANDFELAMKDVALLNILNKASNDNYHITYKHIFDSSKHFIFHKPVYYRREGIEAFSSYLTFYLIVKICKNQEISIRNAEKIFTDQILLNILNKKVFSTEDHSSIFKYWDKSKKILSNFVSLSNKYKKSSTNTMVYINCIKHKFKIHIPLVGYLNDDEVEIVYYGQHKTERKPWYQSYVLYKIYDYFMERGVTIKKFHYFSFNLDNFSEPDLISIPFTDNVENLINRYRKIEPYPFNNIFDETIKRTSSLGVKYLLNENTV